MNNPLRILEAVDARLGQTVELCLFGRAALALEFDNPPQASMATQDVDAIIPRDLVASLHHNLDWWAALESANRELESEGLYLTHLFEEEQVILRSNWRQHAVAMKNPGLRFLRLQRPATTDPILTKMMRSADPQDMEDVRFYLNVQPDISAECLQTAFALATGPDVPEIWEHFEAAKPAVLAMAGAKRQAW